MNKYLLCALLFVATTAVAVEISPQQDGGVFIKLSKDEVEVCNSEGGCFVATKNGFEAIIVQAAAQACGSKI